MNSSSKNSNINTNVDSSNSNSNNNNNIDSSKTRKSSTSLIAGLGSGFITCLLCQPLDIIKVRFQVQGALSGKSHKYSGIVQSAQLILREEGLRGFYKGLGPALITIPSFGLIFWGSYDFLKHSIASKYPQVPQEVVHLLSAISAGALGDVVTNPFFVTKIRMQTLALHSKETDLHPSTYNMMKSIYEKEGIATFYKGLYASFLGLSHVAIQFPLYEYLKKKARERHEGTKEDTIDLIGASLGAKLVACVLTYPHEVLRSRIQDRQSKFGIVTLVRTMIKKEGVFSLWAGLSVNLVRTVPATISTFLSYEYISRIVEES